MKQELTKFKFDFLQFRKDIITKRIIVGRLNLRDAAKQIGISHATLSRAEYGSEIKLDTFIKITIWLDSNPNNYFIYC